MDRGQTYHEWKAYELAADARYWAREAEIKARDRLWQGRNRSRTPPPSKGAGESRGGTPEKVYPIRPPRRDPLDDLMD